MLFDRRWSTCWPAPILLAPGLLALAGCASPGAPRPPSLQLPETARNLVAVREGDQVHLRFNVSPRTTDGQPVKSKALQGELCRQDAPGDPCKPIDEAQTAASLPLGEQPSTADIVWTDTLPATLREGPPRVVGYRVTLKNDAGKSAGPSDPVYVAAGAAPAEVKGLSVEGTRRGALVQWTRESDRNEILIRRVQLNPHLNPKPAAPPPPAAPPGARHTRPAGKGASARALGQPHPHGARAVTEPDSTWLVVPQDGLAQGKTIDGTVAEGVTYRYVAVRRAVVKVGGRSLELRSAPSAPVELTWRDVYPPPVPEQLTGIGYVPNEATAGQSPAQTPHAGYAVDLVWQPVDDLRVTGYVVSRQALTSAGAAVGPPEQLTAQPVPTPGFHDATADPHTAYRYAVSSTDARGNTSSAATVVVSPSPR